MTMIIGNGKGEHLTSYSDRYLLYQHELDINMKLMSLNQRRRRNEENEKRYSGGFQAD